MSSSERTRILLMMSGSIACAKASTLISSWVKRGYTVRVACTLGASEFTGPATLQGLGAESVFDQVFAPGQAMEHISLAQWADIVVVAPATSNLINKLVAGIADDAVSTVWQAAYGRGKPMVIVPAMNTRMWQYPATRRSVGQLREWGVHVLPVRRGELACGEVGDGRMLEPDEILCSVDRLLVSNAGANTKRILITAGGTREPIDSVRYIGNLSTGRTAARLADELAVAGHQVTWLGAEDAIKPSLVTSMVHFRSFADIEQQMSSLLGSNDYDMVIHAAAISDFSVSAIENSPGVSTDDRAGKISSDSDLLLHLKRNPKLLGQIKTWSRNPHVRVIGFKLTDTEDPEKRLAAVRKQFADSAVDAVVHNDLRNIRPGNHPFFLHAPRQSPLHCADSNVLAGTIDKLMRTF